MTSLIKHAFRVLLKNPGFTLISIFSMAIGIGATSAMFSFADALLLRPLPVKEPSGVVAISAAGSAFAGDPTISYADYIDLRNGSRSFHGLVAAGYAQFGFSPTPQALPRMKFGLYVSGNFFSVLGVEPALGRMFRADEDQARRRDPVVVLGHDFWVGQFGASPSVLGTRILLNGIEHTIIGVASERFTGIDQYLRPALFLPLAMYDRMTQENNLDKREFRWLLVKGRLLAGVNLSRAQAEVGGIVARLQRDYPQTNRDQTLKVETEVQLRAEQSPPNAAMAGMLLFLGLLVLAVACANVAGLLLSRSRARAGEMALRLAIGANRLTLIRQLLFENLLVAIAGGFGGILVAGAGARFLHSFPIPSDLPIVIAAEVDHRVLLFTLAVSALSTLVFGLAPAIGATRLKIVPALKAADADSVGRKSLWSRNTIVAGQMAVSLVLLVLSAVLLQGFRDQLMHGPGFRTERLLLASFETQLAHSSEDQTRQFYANLLQRTRSASGVRSAALTSAVPMIGGDNIEVVPEGYAPSQGRRTLSVFHAYVSEGYFSALQIPIQRGRDFLQSDRAGAPLVAIINERAAGHFWPNQDALGKRFRLRSADGGLVQVVGVAKTVKYFWIAEPPLDYIYLPFRQHPRSSLSLIAESTAPDASTLVPILREVIRGLDPNMPVFDVRTMHDLYFQRAVKTPDMIVAIVAGLGFMGLLLAAVGLYGVVLYSVSRRTREIGIRLAIGANQAGVIAMVLKQGLRLGGTGIAIGTVLSVFVCRFLTTRIWLATFSHVNILVYFAIGALLLLITVLAALAPARRASLINPICALREQ
jgi:predicted permease